jgi:hypothetical protein
MRMFGFQPKPGQVPAVRDRHSLLPRRRYVVTLLSGVLVAVVAPAAMANATTTLPSADPIFVVTTPGAGAPTTPSTPSTPSDAKACAVVEKLKHLRDHHGPHAVEAPKGPAKTCLSGFLSSTLNDNQGSRWK